MLNTGNFNMKLKYFIVNIIILIALFLICDFLFYCFIDSKINNEKFKFNFKSYVEASKIQKFDDVYKQLKNINYLRHIKTNKNNKSIMLFGCSFAYGHSLNENQTLAYKLSKISGYNINNQSISSLGIQYFPYILEHFDVNDYDEKNTPQNKEIPSSTPPPHTIHYICYDR